MAANGGVDILSMHFKNPITSFFCNAIGTMLQINYKSNDDDEYYGDDKNIKIYM